jgi:hypothetical protein
MAQEDPMRKRWSAFPLLILALAIVSPPAADAQEKGYRLSFKNFSIEIYGGYSGLNPGDFNISADYEEAYLQFYYIQRFAYFHSVYGDDYTVASRRTGDGHFKPITSGFPVGARIRYAFSPSLSVSIGAQYLNVTQGSRVGMIVDVQDSHGGYADSPNLLTYQYQNSGFELSASAWILQAGAHFGWELGPRFRVEAFVVGGPMFAQCRSISEQHATMTDQTGYRSNRVFSLEMKGSAAGASVELGGQLRFKAASHLDIFLEGSYAFREADELKGPGWSKTTTEDSNTGQDVSSASWNGQWSVVLSNANTDWGRFQAWNTSNDSSSAYFYNSGTRRFVLILSGLQLKAGFAVKF